MGKTNTLHYKLKDMEGALLSAAGIPSVAAKILAKAYGHCSGETVRSYMRRFPKLREVVDNAVETNLDLAESKLLVALNNGADWAVKFYLETKGKHRGYTKRQEIAGVAGQPMVVTGAGRDWIASELEQMAARLRPQPDGAAGPAAGPGTDSNPQKTFH